MSAICSNFHLGKQARALVMLCGLLQPTKSAPALPELAIATRPIPFFRQTGLSQVLHRNEVHVFVIDIVASHRPNKGVAAGARAAMDGPGR